MCGRRAITIVVMTLFNLRPVIEAASDVISDRFAKLIVTDNGVQVRRDTRLNRSREIDPTPQSRPRRMFDRFFYRNTLHRK